MKYIWIFLLCSLSLYASEESQEKYSQYQDTGVTESVKHGSPSDIAPIELEEESEESSKEHAVSMKIFDKRGFSVSIDGKVVLLIKDHIAEIHIKKEEEKKECILL